MATFLVDGATTVWNSLGPEAVPGLRDARELGVLEAQVLLVAHEARGESALRRDGERSRGKKFAACAIRRPPLLFNQASLYALALGRGPGEYVIRR
jgi:hypothetical protein